MFDHISIGVSDMARSRSFYDAVLATLGYKRVMTFDAFAGYGTDDGYPRFCINPPLDKTKPAAPGPGTHICFQAPGRKAVQAFHAAALANGATDDLPASARTTTPNTSRPSCSTPTATRSRRSRTAPNDAQPL